MDPTDVHVSTISLTWFIYKHLILLKTRQACNLFQNLWNRKWDFSRTLKKGHLSYKNVPANQTIKALFAKAFQTKKERTLKKTNVFEKVAQEVEIILYCSTINSVRFMDVI